MKQLQLQILITKLIHGLLSSSSLIYPAPPPPQPILYSKGMMNHCSKPLSRTSPPSGAEGAHTHSSSAHTSPSSLPSQELLERPLIPEWDLHVQP